MLSTGLRLNRFTFRIQLSALDSMRFVIAGACALFSSGLTHDSAFSRNLVSIALRLRHLFSRHQFVLQNRMLCGDVHF
jgi:hypothetical protein